jgi:hypothetical protein
MDDDKRSATLLDLARQHMQRFNELEQIEWKINFSVWGFFGGLAFLWVNSHMAVPDSLTKHSIIFVLLAPLPALLFHGLALYWLNVQQQEQAELRDKYRQLTVELLGQGVPTKITLERHGGVRRRDWKWIGWDLLVTFVIALVAIFLVLQSAAPAQPLQQWSPWFS